jgi:sensor histidine kinase YesM
VRNTTGAAAPGRDGIGLRNVRERLAVHFAEHGALVVRSELPTVWTSVVQLPLLREPVAPVAAGASGAP